MRLLLMITLLFTTLFSFQKVTVLSPEEAFVYDVQMVDETLQVQLKLGENIYLYDDKLQFELTSPTQKDLRELLQLGDPQEYLEFQVYFDDIDVKIPLSQIANENFSVKLSFQGCSKRGICYAPMSKEYDFNLTTKVSTPSVEQQSKFINEQDTIASMLANKSFLAIMISFFGFGLLLSLTPCIFPMIPILSSLLVAKGEKVDAKRGFFISLVYVLSMALTYTVAGVLAGLFGANIQAAFQTPWVIILFSLLFVALSLSMFGLYDLELPQSLQTKLTKTSDKARVSGGVVGIAIMGLLSALIVGPCVAAPLAGALIYIGQSGDALLGGAALFVMSIGMGVPLLIIGAGAGKFMPRPGAWMDGVKNFFGVVLLGVAIWMLSRVVPIEVTMILSSVLLIASAVVFDLFEQSNKFVKVVLLFAFLYGSALFVGVLAGSNNMLRPLEIFGGKSASKVQKKLLFKNVTSLQELQKVIANAKKPLFVDFYADWCVSCVELEISTFTDPKVRSLMANFELIKVDVTNNSDEDTKMLQHFGLFGPPGLLFFKDKEELSDARVVGYVPPSQFATHLQKVLEDK
jgi:thiol:disulfide interchange protein DsbD